MADEKGTSRGARLLFERLVILFSILATFFPEGWRADRAPRAAQPEVGR